VRLGARVDPTAPEKPPLTLTPEEIMAASWEPWLGEYEKQHYWLLLPREVRGPGGDVSYLADPTDVVGRSTVHCWPNAGFMVSCDGSGRQWRPHSSILVCPAGLWPPRRPGK